MNDLKLYVANQNQLTKQLEIVKQLSEDICMDFGLDKCATLNLTQERKSSRGGIQVDHTTFIMELDRGENYKYLGVLENETIDHKQMR